MTKPLDNYSGSMKNEPNLRIRPRTVDELVAFAHQCPRPLTLRATGNSLHDQALGEETVVFLDALPHRVLVRPNDRVTRDRGGDLVMWHTLETTGWTPWEVVMRAALRLDPPAKWDGELDGHWDVSGGGAAPPDDGRNVCAWDSIADPPRLVPYVVPSSGRVTVGGSLSGDTMWRFSGCFGKESRSVAWLDLLVYREDPEPSYEVHRLLNAEAGLFDHADLHGRVEGTPLRFASTREENDTLFNAVLGGFGSLGPILRAKYMLLELDESLRHDQLQQFPPRVAGTPKMAALLDPEPEDPWLGEEEQEEVELLSGPDGFELPFPKEGRIDPVPVTSELVEALLSPKAEKGFWSPDPEWPSYPHASEAELGEVGAKLPQQALTWMWEVRHPDVLFDTLLAHLSDQQRQNEAQPAGLHLPQRTTSTTVSCFGLFFPNRRKFRAVIGNVGFAIPPTTGVKPFKMWNRRYGWKNLGNVIRALPWIAQLGEAIVYHLMFDPCIEDTEEGKPRVNPIPEFALFMEGHSVALSAMEAKPKTLQQTWVMPAGDDDASRADARKLFRRFLAAVSAASRRSFLSGDAVRIQICDVKALPPGHALLSSSFRDGPAIAVTCAVEDVADYERNAVWGEPIEAFRQISRDFRADGVRVHLTKNLCVDPADLQQMYEEAFARLTAIKQTVDPHRIWSSIFLESKLP